MAEVLITFTGQAQDINDFSFDLFETQSLGGGSQKEIPGGGTLIAQPMMVRKAFGIPRVFEVVLSVGGGVALNVVSSYIYDKLRSHKGGEITITINRHEVHLDRSEIKRIIEEEVKIQRK